MSAPTPSPDLPPPPSGQWAHPMDEKSEPKKKNYALWVVFGAAGCLVAVVIAGFLLTILVPNLLRASSRGQHAKAQNAVDIFCVFVEIYAETHGGRYPESLEALQQPELSIDVWGHPYHYEPPNAERAWPEVYSLGSDGLPGGEGEAADVYPIRPPWKH